MKVNILTYSPFHSLPPWEVTTDYTGMYAARFFATTSQPNPPTHTHTHTHVCMHTHSYYVAFLFYRMRVYPLFHL